MSNAAIIVDMDMTLTTTNFVNNLKVDAAQAGPLISTMFLIAEAMDNSQTPSASMISEYVKVWTKLNALSSNDPLDPVEEFLAGR